MDAADVIVIGGGNAGLCAALAAAERKARVLLLERAPTEARGGNSAVTAGAFRFPYRGLEDIAQIVKDPSLEQPDKIEIGRYSEEDFSTDLRRVTQGEADPALGRTLVSQAFPTMQWLRGRGVEFVLAYDRQSFLVNGRHRFWGGLIIKTQGGGPGRVGARPFGQWSGCHAVAWDLNAPAANERRLVQHFERDSYPLGIYVNIRGERFVDEGEDFRNYTYARYGQEIMRQPLQVAFQLFDQQAVHLLKKPYTLPGTTRVEGETLEALARTARIEVATLKRTIAAYNAAVNGEEFNPAVKDGKAALGITPPKSNWAQRLDSPPYLCFPVTCGITFTFGGLRIGPDAALVNADDRKLAGLFACGELAAGLFYHNYPGGSGLMAGAVFGRLAGMGAAAYAGHAG